MKAVFHDQYGSHRLLDFRDLPAPKAGPGQVLVRVRAAGVNRGDALAVAGLPYAARLSYGLTGPNNPIPGTDMAGRVEAVGDEVTGFEPGDDVYGWGHGALAEYTTVDTGRLVRKPAAITFQQAAATPTSGVAALQGLRDVGRIEAGQDVLVVGASGGVGTFAVQIAKAFGAKVTGVSSTRNVELVRSAGAEHVVDYTREDYTRRQRQYDLVLDLVGKAPLAMARRVVRPGGTYVVVGGGTPRSVTGMRRFANALLLSPFGRQRLRPLLSKRTADDLAVVSDLLGSGRVRPIVDAVHDLADTAAAFHYVHAGHARGNVVVTT